MYRFEHDQVNCMMQCTAKLACGHHCMGMYGPGRSNSDCHTDRFTELCSDSCKCQTCDRRVGGHRSMLKPANNGATSSRPPPSRKLHPTSGVTASANPPLSGSPDKWRTYINGGSQADDARLQQMHMEEKAAFDARRSGTPRIATTATTTTAVTDADASVSGKLIETSPRKPAVSVSGNTSLLLDLDIGTEYEVRQPQRPRGTYASAAGSSRTAYEGSEWSLLD